MLNTITSRITQLLDVVLPAAMSAGFLSVMIYMTGNAVGLLAWAINTKRPQPIWAAAFVVLGDSMRRCGTTSSKPSARN